MLTLIMIALAQLTDGGAVQPACPDAYRCEIFCCEDVYVDAGPCPNCGIPLRTVSSIEQKLSLGKTAAILIFPGVQVIDFAGPHEVLGSAGFRVITVSRFKGTLRTDEGLALVPDFDFESCPDVDVVVLPGGKLYPDSETVRWIQQRAADENVDHLLSVCNGLAWLDAADLIDGLEVTTTASTLPRLIGSDPRYRFRGDRRVIDSGKIITSGGYTSGIDGALQIVARVRGPGAAELLAMKLEHDWRPDSSMFTERRAYYTHLRPILRAFDRHVPALHDAPILDAVCTSDRAEVTWLMPSETSLDECFAQIAIAMTGTKTWQPGIGGPLHWMSSNPDGWRSTVKATPSSGAESQLLVLLHVWRLE